MTFSCLRLCLQCGKDVVPSRFSSGHASLYRTHRTAHGTIASEFVCEWVLNKETGERCGKEFTNNRDLQRHIDSVHEGVKHKCPHCDYEATEKTKLVRHIKTVHLQVKAFKCNQCTAAYAQSTELKDHINWVHLGVKLKCPHCDAEYTATAHLNTHIRKEHK